MSVLLETTVGDIVVDLYTNERKRCCLNFLKLCKMKYYNYCLFFSVQSNYVAQTGDPTGTGRGGESVFKNIYGDQARYFDMEVKPKIKHLKKGMVSFVNNGNNQHGSQFFITLGSNLDYLDGKHTVFGEVSEGFDVLEKFNDAICDDNDRPYQDIRLNHTIILDDPFDDPDGLEVPDRSPEPTKEQLQSDRIGADENINEFEGKTQKEIEEIVEEKNLQIGTQILQMVGDIPDADLKPPENVMFICKLNPVTSADDLEIIFSRFGKILSCEIIRDHKTGDSLCYGFIEFEKVEECEKAYFKMDNVLIDDRRIHVDFCQSITKSKWSRSGLKGKYSFASSAGPVKEMPQKKLEIRDKSGKKDKYQMVFQSDEERDRPSGRKEKDQEPEKYRKRDRLGRGHEREAKRSDSDRAPSDDRRRKKKKPLRRSDSSIEEENSRKEGSKRHRKDVNRHRYGSHDSEDERKRTIAKARYRASRSSSQSDEKASSHKRNREYKKQKRRTYSSSSDDQFEARRQRPNYGRKSRR